MKCWYRGRDSYSFILEIDMETLKKRIYFASYDEMVEYVNENDLEPQNFIA